MSESNAVALQDDSLSLYALLEQRRAQARRLELQVSRKEAELRRAVEEQTLLRELRTVNEVTLLQRQNAEEMETSDRLKIDSESLAEVIALENEIKYENGRTMELQQSANDTSRQMEEVEKGIENLNNRMTLMKDTLRGDTKEVGALNVINEWLMRKKNLTALHEEQKTVKALTTLLSERIETLTKELHIQKEKENELSAARETLREKSVQYENLLEQLKSMERLTRKKERLLDTVKKPDDYKTLKRLEGDKKVLYGTLSKFRETNASNTKSILSLEVRLKHLETKLDAVNQFLQHVFADMDEGTMEDVPQGATEVPLQQFEELCRKVDISRETLIERDGRLSAYDTKVEQLDKKTCILQNAIASRATSAQLEVKTKEKEFEALMSHVDYMKAEFDEEYAKFAQENLALRAKLAQIS